VSLSSIQYERCGVLYNLAALYSQLSNLESRSNAAGIKQALIYYQVSSHSYSIPQSPLINAIKIAAGALNYLRTQALPLLLTSLDSVSKSMLPFEFQDICLNGLEDLMLAQGQECAWQMASLGSSSLNFQSSRK